jgi:CDGSH-type Zn-finger protein
LPNEPIKIKLIPNGSIKLESGSFEITRSDGQVDKKDAPFFLCRCGQSKTKPYCDGSHKTNGFVG